MSLILSGTDGLSDVDGSAATPAIRGTDANTGIFFPAADTIAFAEGGAEVARFDSAGKFGINTTPAAGTDAKLQVTGGTTNATTLATSYSVASTVIVPKSSSGYSLAIASGTSDLPLLQVSAGGAASGGLLIQPYGGNMGLGTSSPLSAAKVTIKQASGGGDGSTQLHLEQSNTTDGYDLKCDAANGHLDFARYVSGSANTRMRLDADGNLILAYGGQVVTAFSAPQGMTISSLDNVALQYYLRKGNQVEAHIGFKSSTDTNFYVGTSGNPGPGGIGTFGVYQANTASSWTAVSDERFKTELQTIENALAKVAGVRAVTGRYSHDEENGVTKRRSFLIAQDFLTALPEAVDQQNPDQLGLSYTDTIPLLVAAIKEQQAIITALTARITALETP